MRYPVKVVLEAARHIVIQYNTVFFISEVFVQNISNKSQRQILYKLDNNPALKYNENKLN